MENRKRSLIFFNQVIKCDNGDNDQDKDGNKDDDTLGWWKELFYTRSLHNVFYTRRDVLHKESTHGGELFNTRRSNCSIEPRPVCSVPSLPLLLPSTTPPSCGELVERESMIPDIGLYLCICVCMCIFVNMYLYFYPVQGVHGKSGRSGLLQSWE